MRRSFVLPTLALALLAACSQQVPTPASADQGSATQASLPVLDSLTTQQVGAQATEPYNITLRFVGNPTQTFKDAANAAARRWERAITAGLPNVSGSFSPSQQCGASAPDFSGSIDDILIDVGVANIDGPGQILAESGPCLVRSGSNLTIYGSLIFDTADQSAFSSQLSSILVHEMGHSLGIGTLWTTKGLLVNGGTSNPTYKGARGITEWRTLGGSGNVPVENTGGPGTAGGHWRETTFNNELMTGFINSGSNPLSRLSIASLGDLGYTVNVGAADAYSLPSGALSRQADSKLDTGERLLTPKYQSR